MADAAGEYFRVFANSEKSSKKSPVLDRNVRICKQGFYNGKKQNIYMEKVVTLTHEISI